MLSQAGELTCEADSVKRTPVVPRDRTAFLHLMRTWFIQTGRTSDAIPKIGGKPLDLHQLYIEVEILGGPEKVQSAGLWRLVAVKMGYVTHDQNDPQMAQIAKILVDAYVALLVPFNTFCTERAIETGLQNLGLNDPAIGIGALESARPESAAGQTPGMPEWQQPGPSTSQLSQGSPPGPSISPFQSVHSPQPSLDQANQARASSANDPGRQTVVPRDRTAFLYLMRMWFVQTGRTSDAIPKIGDKPLDLHRLYIEVEALGGPERVQAASLWRLIGIKMGYATHDPNDLPLAQTAQILVDACATFLVPFNNFCVERMRALGTRMIPGDANPTANFQRILAFLQVSLNNWMPELSGQDKLLRASQMDIPEMQRQGWPPERISVIQRFRPTLMEYQATFLRQQELQRLSQQEQEQPTDQAQVNQDQQPQQPQRAQQLHLDDHHSPVGGGSLSPNMQAHNLGLPSLKLPFPPEAMNRAKLVVESIAREIEDALQHQSREAEMQRVRMNQTVVASHPFATEFERTASLYFMLFNDHQQTRALLEQAALLREQHRILQNGEQHYIMTLEEVQNAQNALRMAIHNMKATYGARVKQHQEAVANLRANENEGASGAQPGQQT